MGIKNMLLSLGLLVSTIQYAQEIVTSSGGSMENSNTHVNWSIGEPIIETYTGDKTVVTSGINQPVIKITSSIVNISDRIVVYVFPNPTSQLLNIKYEGQLPLNAKIINFNGQVVLIFAIKNTITQLYFGSFANGVYTLVLSDKLKKINIYRIVKQ